MKENMITVMETRKKRRQTRFVNTVFVVTACALLAAFPAFATDGPDLSGILENLINEVLAPIFITLGILGLIAGIGLYILAWKNEDADSKNRAAMSIVVGVVLIGIRGIIAALNLTQYLPG